MPLKTCPKCGIAMEEANNFFSKNRKGNEPYPLCKDCLCSNVDLTDPDTFMWILKEFDVPYIKATWSNTANKIYLKDPNNYNAKTVLGRYLRTMNIKQYKGLSFDDTDRCNDKFYGGDVQWIADRAETVEIDEDYEEKLKRQLSSGEISEAQYSTLTMTNIKDLVEQRQDRVVEVAPIPNVREIVPNGLLPEQSLRTQYIAHGHSVASQLTEEDIIYLSMKWGEEYTPEEWVRMEKMYKNYSREYELNIDREETLRFMCMTTVKMEEALKNNQINEYKNLSQVLDNLRKSGKFTEAQNKDDEVRYVDSVGEIVAFCEREEGFIPNTYDADEAPQDIIDKILKDMKGYTYNLVKKELGLGDLIESYMRKLDEAAQTKMDQDSLMSGVYTSAEEEAFDAVTELENFEFDEYLEAASTADELYLSNNPGVGGGQ